MSKEVLLDVQNVGKEFFGNKVLNDINFSLSAGEIVGLVGENGAGKSTLMKILFGMNVIKETGGYTGDIFFDGKKAEFHSPFDAIAAGIGMVHQEFSLLPGFSAAENILLNREIKNKSIASEVFGPSLDVLDREEMKKTAKQSIERLGVSIDPDMLASNMSVAYKQFTEIARELSKKHLKLLILDEPTAVLTENESQIMLRSIKAIAEEGIAVIFITHRLSEIMSLCNKVLVMRDGLIVSNTAVKDTNIAEITRHMVKRDVSFTDKSRRKASENAEAIMTISNLWVDMPGETVKDVSLTVRKGEILGIGGLAGAGKLGIPNGIMGLYNAGGEVIFKGEKIPLNSPRVPLDRNIAFVSEDRRGVGLLLDETLEWNIAFPAMQVKNRFLKKYLSGLVKWRDREEIKKITDYYIQLLNIKCTSSKQNAKELSGGNQQKICLAKEFALEPEILFVSEPTRGIDVGAKALVLDALRDFNEKKNVTIVVVSSELEELRMISDRIAIVSDGRIAGILPAGSSSEEFGSLMVGGAR